MNGERRSPLFLLTGVVIGFALGLVYAWVFTPVESVETLPVTLQEDYKDFYREMIAVAYIASGDLGRAKARLDLLGDEDPVRALTVQAQLTLGEDGSEDIAQALGVLAAHLAGDPDFLPTEKTEPPEETESEPAPTDGVSPPTETPTSSPTHTATDAPETEQPDSTGETEVPAQTTTLLPSVTPTAIQSAPFTLLEIALDCGIEYQAPLIQVYAVNAVNIPVPGAEAFVIWDGGRDNFFTGFKPEFGLGYADFEMTPEITYVLQLVDGDKPVPGLVAQECEGDGGERYWGSWRLTFKQP
jgi:hypothetical protein